jgi:SAM-dependent methyltransferase
MDSRELRERDFHNERFTDDTVRAPAAKYYAISRPSWKIYRELVAANAKDATILEYGCGQGGLAFSLAKQAKSITGIDISDVAVKHDQEKATRLGIENVTFEVMNAEQLEFPDSSFDLIFGSAILHHLDLRKAYSQLTRTLKPGGKAVFFEPLGHNFFINAYRKATKQMRTVDEHPLHVGDVELSREYFSSVDMRFYHFHTLLAVPLRKTSIFEGAVKALDGIDAAMFAALPFLRRYAWIVVMTFSNPKKVEPNRLHAGAQAVEA